MEFLKIIATIRDQNFYFWNIWPNRSKNPRWNQQITSDHFSSVYLRIRIFHSIKFYFVFFFSLCWTKPKKNMKKASFGWIQRWQNRIELILIVICSSNHIKSRRLLELRLQNVNIKKQESKNIPCSLISVSQYLDSSLKYLSKMNTFDKPMPNVAMALCNPIENENWRVVLSLSSLLNMCRCSWFRICVLFFSWYFVFSCLFRVNLCCEFEWKCVCVFVCWLYCSSSSVQIKTQNHLHTKIEWISNGFVSFRNAISHISRNKGKSIRSPHTST